MRLRPRLFAGQRLHPRRLSHQFASITEWLLAAGLIAAGLTGAIALIDFLGDHRFRTLPDNRIFAAGSALVVLLELANFALRQTSGAAAITPTGLILSLAAVAVLLATPSRNWASMYR